MNEVIPRPLWHKRAQDILWGLFLATIFALGFMYPHIRYSGYSIHLIDVLFVVTFGSWIALVVFRVISLKFLKVWILFALYFIALLISLVFSDSAQASAVKLMGVLYLILLATMTSSLINTLSQLRRVFLAWLFATFVVAVVSVLSLVLFYSSPDAEILHHTLSHYGTLPEGNYPRIQSTFLNPNMLNHYFLIGMMMALAALSLGWLSNRQFVFLAIPGAIAIALTLSPGLAAIGVCFCLWVMYLCESSKLMLLKKMAMLCATVLVILGFLVLIASPYPPGYSAQPLVLNFPGLDTPLYSSGRLLTWQSAWQTYLDSPVLGAGIGANASEVIYQTPWGKSQFLTDAHNIWLNIMTQAGIFGVISLTLIALVLLHNSRVIHDDNSQTTVHKALGIAIVGAFFYSGLSGSFEDARHLWVLFGIAAAVQKPGFKWES